MDADQIKDNNPAATREVFDSIPEPVGQEEPETIQQEEVETQEENPESETPNVETPEEDASPRTAKSRIREQSDTINKLEDTIEQLVGLDMFGNPVLPEISVVPGQEISPDQYKQDVAKTAQAITQIEIAKARNADRIKAELRDSMSDYPELNPRDKASYDDDISESVSESVTAFIKGNPRGNVRAFIDKQMAPYRKSVEKKVQQETARTQENVAKQASQTALRPTQTVATSKKFEDMSMEEMEKKLGKVY